MLSIVFGLICGIALGLTGGGGSILGVPLLVYGVGIPFHHAVTISLLIVGVTALIGFLPKIKKGEVELSAGVTLAITGMIFAPIGSYVGRYLNDQVLLIAFSLLMALIGIWSLLKSKFIAKKNNLKQPYCRYLSNGKLQLSVKCKAVLLISGTITGVLTGLFGVGGGFLIVPALTLAAKMPIKKAISTSLLIIFLVSTVGFVSHIRHVSVNFFITLFFTIGSIFGMLLAGNIKTYLSDNALHKLFSFALIILGGVMLSIQLQSG